MSKKLEETGCESPDKMLELFMVESGFMQKSTHQLNVHCLHVKREKKNVCLM